MADKNFVVTFARGFGTGGKVIASKLAADLGVHCYENRILTLASQLSGLDEISFRAMMGEFIIYYKGKIIGGVYDNRLLVKPVPAVLSLVAAPRYELPYEGAKEMILVEDIDNKEFLARLVSSMYEELPEAKKKRRKSV